MQGDIVTNNHVIDGADKVTVTFSDGHTTVAKVVGRDPDSDLAVIKIDTNPAVLKPVKLADSDQVKVGQLAIAIGNPFGLEGTMTVGIVSAKNRSLPVDSQTSNGPVYTIPDVIQTDAPINPGNSGGVLVNAQGEVMGVTAAIESPVRASAGIGFVIPANIVKSVIPTLIDKGTIQHPWLGISGTELTADLAKAMSLKEDQSGILVVDVTSGSPADKAGLRGSDRQVTIDGTDTRVGGDVITSVDGQPLKRFEDLAGYLFESSTIGKPIKLEVLRDGKVLTIDATPAARPAQTEQANNSTDVVAAKAWLGIRGVDVSPEIAAAMGLSDGQQGVLVIQVVQGGPADQAGLKGSNKPATLNGQDVAIDGDIITAVNSQKVSDMNDLQTTIAQMKAGDKATLDLLRDGKSLSIDVTLGERPAG
jgi:S1-C subfamily serine protease